MAGMRNQLVSLGTLFLALKGKLIADGVIPFDYCIASDTTEQGLPPPTDQYVTIVFAAQNLDHPVFAGGGRTVHEFDGQVAIFLWNRLTLDPHFRDDSQLTDAVFGGFERERLILRALNGFDPTDAAGNPLLSEPMRIQSYHLQPRKTQPGWNGIGSAWQLRYQLDVVGPGYP
jgi:hypothetical protein